MKILQLGIWIIGGLLLTNCVMNPSYSFSYKDISGEAKMEHLIGRCLVLKQDVFLFQFSDTKTYALEVPGTWTAIPSSINEYQKDPLNWQNTDSNALRGKGPKQNYAKKKIIGVIPKGTEMFVSSILEKRTFYESFVKVLGNIDDPEYSHLDVDLYFLLKIEHGDILIPCSSELDATVMGREIIPYPKAGVIEYCD